MSIPKVAASRQLHCVHLKMPGLCEHLLAPVPSIPLLVTFHCRHEADDRMPGISVSRLSVGVMTWQLEMCHSFQCWQHCLHLEHPSSLQVCNTVRQGHASQVVGGAYDSIFTFACFSKRGSLENNPSLSLRRLCSPQYSATLTERNLSNTGPARRPSDDAILNTI